MNLASLRGMSTSNTRADLSEWRRRRAWELHEQGWWQKDIAAALGVSRAAVCQWLKRAREVGVQALRTRPRPRGQTPALCVKLTRDHLSAISGITFDGRLVMQVQDAAFDAQGVVGFLRVLLRKVRGKALVIWDGSPIHNGRPIKDYLAHGAAQ